MLLGFIVRNNLHSFCYRSNLAFHCDSSIKKTPQPTPKQT
ncbi:hypothetical protein HMPREF0022_01274 [Acinetobacter baumannii 6014059]|uniref:Uncharacterized protein n=1 Tax=Acinetobacter baumannii 6014059 TaxID=525242 RepID=A0A828SW20_ACIBA|nr:hypothetical protein HMPREF0022_01274 [Acinetobacter baumannii 6014059]